MSGHRKTARCKPVIMMDVTTAMLRHTKKGRRHLPIQQPSPQLHTAPEPYIPAIVAGESWNCRCSVWRSPRRTDADIQMSFMQMNEMQVSQQGRDNKVILMLRVKLWQSQAFMEQLVYQIQNRSSQLKIIRPRYIKQRSWVSRSAIWLIQTCTLCSM